MNSHTFLVTNDNIDITGLYLDDLETMNPCLQIAVKLVGL